MASSRTGNGAPQTTTAAVPGRLSFETGERHAYLGGTIGALVGLVVALFTSPGDHLVPAVASLALFGIMVSGVVSLASTLLRAGRSGAGG